MQCLHFTSATALGSHFAKSEGEDSMKRKKTLILAASILMLTLSAFPHHAAASPTTPPPPPPPPTGSKGTHISKVTIEVFLPVLLPLVL
jgi:hypothetical protein